MYDIKAVEFGQQQQQQQQQNSEPKCSNNNNSGSSKKRLTTSATPPPATATATATQTASTAPSGAQTKTRTCDSTPTASANYFLTNLSRSYSTCHVLTPKHPEPSDPAEPHQYFNQHHHHQHHQAQHQHADKVNIDINTGSNGNRISSITGGLNDFSSDCSSSTSATSHMTLLSLRRRRVIQRHACLISIVAAFTFGLVLGVLMPMFGLANVFGSLTVMSATAEDSRLPVPLIAEGQHMAGDGLSTATRPPSDFPTIYELRSEQRRAEPNAVDSPYSVAFIKEQNRDLSGEEVFRNAFHLQLDKNAPAAMIVKKLDSQEHSIKEFRVQRTHEGRFRKGPERRISKPSLGEQFSQSKDGLSFVPLEKRIAETARSQRSQGLIKEDIYWGDAVERALPKGFSPAEAKDWNRYVSAEGVVERLEPGCGRMQNRLITFADGTRACARYRQNTDQIQGELFSFYLGQLLGLTNLAPSAPAVINLDSSTWSSAIADITQSQWKQQRPVVLTRWLPDLEPAGIPQPFQPLERHLNKFDVWNITLGAGAAAASAATSKSSNKNSVAAADDEEQQQQQKGLLKRLEPPTAARSQHDHQSLPSLNLTQAIAEPQPLVMQRLIELAQWSDLIVFDYLIANLDRVVNNLYNFQWNADIMAAPAHNLARQINTQLLVFLDNESGLLHGYRLLKKYEAYHGLLLDNLCVFRQPTVQALRELRSHGVGRKLRAVFEETTSNEVRDVLPSLPDKSIKILEDRIDRVLGQVQKCRDLLAAR